MNNLLYQLLSCTITMSLISGLFLLVRRCLGERYAPRFRYYTWLVILLGFCLPWRPRISPQVLVSAVAPASSYGLSSQAPLFFYIYAVGVLAFIIMRGFRHSRFRSSVRRLAIPLETGPLYGSLKEVCRDMGLDREFSLSVVPGLSSPMMTGLIRPRILLPTQEFTPEELRLIFRHELVHHQRKDLWYKSLIEVAHVIHWFNPVFLLFKREIEQDLEASCDQRVIFHSTKEEQLLYCHAILQVVRAQGGLHTTFSTSFGNSKEAIQKRFEEILSGKRKRSFLAVGMSFFLLTLLSVQLLCITDNNDYVDAWIGEDIHHETTSVMETTISAVSITYDSGNEGFFADPTEENVRYSNVYENESWYYAENGTNVSETSFFVTLE